MAKLFIEVTDKETGEEVIVGLAWIRTVRQDEEGRAIIWLSDPPDETPLLADDPYRRVREALVQLIV